MNYRQVLRPIARPILRRFPWLRRQLMTSSDYSIVSEAAARQRQAQGWMSPMTALRQERAYKKLLADMRTGHPRVDLAVAAKAVEAAGLLSPRLLEIGCGSGYYSEIFQHFLGGGVDYTGIDYSAAMIRRARKTYPGGKFHVGDATALGFADGSFDIVFNGVSLMHILDYEKAIAESRRVARAACIFHSVPLFDTRITTYLHKYAYGGSVVEIVFNRSALIDCFSRHGLAVAQSWTSIPYDVGHIAGERSFTETFLCRLA